MRQHLFRPNEPLTMCGLSKGKATTNPDFVDCISCLKLYAGNEKWYTNKSKEPR